MLTVKLTPAQAAAIISSIACATAGDWEEAFTSHQEYGAARRAFYKIHEAWRTQSPASYAERFPDA